METVTKRSGLMKGIVIGGAVGVVSSLLLAPKSGAKLREDLSNRCRSALEKSQDFVATIRDKSKAVASTASEQTTELIDKAKEGKQHVIDSLHATMDSIQNVQKSASEEISKRN